MRILTITAQKPNSTGSGFYLTEMVKSFAAQEHEQAVLAGVYKEDTVEFPEGVRFYPVYFKTEELPFPIAGMSDEMPYESTVYGQMTDEMVEQFKAAFRRAIREAAKDFRPDLVVCHHLYLVTSIAREELADYKVCGFCHNTDLRQMKKIPLEREYIRSQIPELNGIFALHEEQKKEIMEIYPVNADKITVAGTGYNSAVFYREKEASSEGEDRQKQGEKPFRLIYAGKIAEKKGVASLIKSLDYLPWKREELEVFLAGGAGNQKEYDWICRLAEECRYPVHFLGKLSQKKLAKEYNKSDVFVLPSFSEGLPLTIMEAMACGCEVIVTDLPGIRPWTEANVECAPILFVEPPRMQNADEPLPESLEQFERKLADAIVACAGMPYEGQPDLSRVSWGNICDMVLADN
ncbi:MAG: glycosyltransferase family 4 protein [Eubacteriales bacterium]|nr:glycosyltransferase family 4 protein [Eubacteriales bacterium]